MSMYKEYLNQRKEYHNSPAFYLDCAHLFFKEKQDKVKETPQTVTSNLQMLDNASFFPKLKYIT